jgi:hypothetical protein
MSARQDLVVWKAASPPARVRGMPATPVVFRQTQLGNAMHARSVREYQMRIHRAAIRNARRLLDVRV